MEVKKLNFKRYQEELNKLLNHPTLQKYGIRKSIVGKSTYGYDLDLISIGFGEKDLFLVGGTHGSEIIGVDFLLYLLKALPTLENFDPNTITLQILPLQNPEGFDISTNTLKNISDENFEKASYEYYLRYRTDSIIAQAMTSFQKMLQKLELQNNTLYPLEPLIQLKQFLNTDYYWNRLQEPRVFPKIKMFQGFVQNIPETNNFSELLLELIRACQRTEDQLNKENPQDHWMFLFMKELEIAFMNILKQKLKLEPFQQKLYQEMFKATPLTGLHNPQLEKEIEKIFQKDTFPKGSQVGYDATGIGINLNANNHLNPGIEIIRKGEIRYGGGVKNNVRNYIVGPLGVPTLDIDHFQYTIENQVLEHLICTSKIQDRYLATLLYHGTGGLIYYKPHQDLMNDADYQKISTYNQELARIYQEKTAYKILEESSTTGYGDYLRRTYPGVLLIELSKMGGNPIGPYGDSNNLSQVFEDNTQAINALLNFFNKKKTLTKH